ncbi:MAG: molecular chaperone HtpG, partial [Zetaproteobacteria bacterium]
PIRMKKSGDAEEVETVNQASALWTRPKSELDDEDYINFYRHIGHDFADPLAWMHQKLEGKFEYTLLFYLPREAPFDLWHADARHGVKLYVRRVFIMDADEKILPRWLRFLRGVMDSSDLPLNVSREMLQESPAMQAMKKGATKRVLSWLESLAKDKPEDYATFWKVFGNCLKEGVIEDFAHREAIAKLLRFSSTRSDEQTVSLNNYVQRMKEGQKAIYYITAETLAAAKNSPHLEIFKARGVEVLLLHDRIDEWLVGSLTEFDGKPLQSVAKGEIDLSDIEGDDQQQEEQARKDVEKSAEQAVKRLKQVLGERVKDVRPTHRLTESPACLVSDAYDISNNMERILKQLGQEAPEHKPILEINPGHPLVKRLAHMRDKDRINALALIIFDQAVLAEGALPEDPAGFVRRVNALLAKERA